MSDEYVVLNSESRVVRLVNCVWIESQDCSSATVAESAVAGGVVGAAGAGVGVGVATGAAAFLAEPFPDPFPEPLADFVEAADLVEVVDFAEVARAFFAGAAAAV